MASTWGTSWGASWGPSWDAEFVTVPDVAGLTQAAAEAAIEAAGLVTQLTTEYSSTVATGQVISQAPPAGASVIAGSAVAIVVSLGEAPALDPKLIGRRKKSKNLVFKPAKRREEKPTPAAPRATPAPAAASPKPLASGLVRTLIERAAAPPPPPPPPPAAPIVVPKVELELVKQPPAPRPAPAPAAAAAAAPMPRAAAAPVAAAPALPGVTQEQLEQRVAALESVVLDRLAQLERTTLATLAELVASLKDAQELRASEIGAVLADLKQQQAVLARSIENQRRAALLMSELLDPV